MSLIRISPAIPALRPMLTDFFDMDRFFDYEPLLSSIKQVPDANIREIDGRYEVELAAPGLKREDFKIQIDDNQLTISAEHKEEKKEDRENYARQEYSYQSFARSFRLPENCQADGIQARYENGILRLQVPKKEAAKAKTHKEISVG